MPELSSFNLTEILSAVLVAIIAAIVAIPKLIKDWKNTGAESSVISLMHTELERLSKQNTDLSIELGRLHIQVITLNKELQELTIENQRLQTEVVALTLEISSLKIIAIKESHGTIKTD